MSLSYEDFLEIVAEIDYVDRAGVKWDVLVGQDIMDVCWLKVQFYDPREPDFDQDGRKWRLSPHMTKSEVVWTAFLAIETAEEHEMRENFRYKGARIGGPHLDVDVLAEVARKVENLDLRDERIGA